MKRKVNKRVEIFPKKNWRPNARDVAALELLMEKYGLTEAQVVRLGIHKLVDFESLGSQVEKKAELLEKRNNLLKARVSA